MTLFISRSAKTGAAPVAGQAGTRMTAIFEYTFNAAFTSASDVLELGVLPAYARPLAATVIGEGLGAITADVGLMTGKAGANDDTRALTGTEFFNDLSVNDNTGSATALAMLAMTRTEGDRGIGVTLSGDVAAGASKKITLILDYVY